MEFKEPDKCDIKNIGLLNGVGKVGGQQQGDALGKAVDSNIVPCDSTSGRNNNNRAKDQVRDKKEAEKMTVDEGSCG